MTYPTEERVHITRLKLMAKSAAHYLSNPRKDSASFKTGRAAHSLLLGDSSKIVVYEGVRNKRTKKYQEFLAANEGKEVFSPAEMHNAQGMRRAIEKHPLALSLLEGHREQYMQWEIDGHKAAGTPDVWKEDGSVVELKTDDDTEPSSFLRSAERYGYHAQLTWYQSGLRAQGLIERLGPLSIVAVESSAPYCVVIIQLDRATAQRGIDLWRGWLDKLAECQLLDEWPGYSKNPVVWSDRQLRLPGT